MEQMIVILVFAFCAAVCVKIISEAHIITTRNYETKNSIITAESGAECFKAFSGDAAKIAATLEGIYTGTKENALIQVYYDEEWRVCQEEKAVYIMSISSYISSDFIALRIGDISVTKKTGEELLSFTTSTRKVEGQE